MTKELFIKRLRLLQNWQSQMETLGLLINKITDGYAVPVIGDYLVDEIIEMINESLKIEDKDLLSWWLYENVDKIIYGEFGDESQTDISTPEQLYDYIIRRHKN